METNKNYILGIEQALADNNLTKDDAVIIMCRSGGTRGAPAANLLFEKGFKKVYVVTDGFEGSSLKDGDKKGWRLKNGWKNSGLPWSYKLNKDKDVLQRYFLNNVNRGRITINNLIVLCPPLFLIC
jgi:rhodanese-related sulfurtransferase